MLTDDQIRSALDLAAERTAQPDRILASLANANRTGRQRRTLLMAAATAGAAAVAVGAVPTVIAARRDSTPVPGTVPPPSSPVPAPLAANETVPLPLRPAWLPDGFVQYSRQASTSNDRTWQRDWHRSLSNDPADLVDAPVIVLLRRAADRLNLSRYTRVTVNDVAGWLLVPQHPLEWCNVYWPAPGPAGYLLGVRSLGPQLRTREELLRVANSVTTDAAAHVEVPARFGWLPDPRLKVGNVYAGSYGPAWLVNMTATVDGDEGRGYARVQVGPRGAVEAIDHPFRSAAVPWQVRGRTGYGWVNGSSGKLTSQGWVVFHERDGLSVRVSLFTESPIARDDIVRVADEIRFGPTPDASWIGAR